MVFRRPEQTASTRQVVAAALVLLVLGTLGAIQAVRAGTSFMFDLEQDRPALAKTPPAIEPAATPRLARRVFLVVIDGLRLDRSYELPYLDGLRREGVDTEASSHYPSYSRPNYVSILTGVPPSASGVRTNHHGSVVLLDSLMDRAHAAELRVALATDYDVLPRLFLRPPSAGPSEDLDAAEDEGPEPTSVHDPDANLVSPFDDARYAPWPGGFAESGAALVGRKADLVVMLVGAVDAAGHEHGGDSKEYRDAAVSADRAIARALAKIDLAQDAVVITADHGHTGPGGHGGVEPEVLAVPLILAGAGVAKGASATDAQLIDIAPTVSALLGIPAPGHGLGRTLVELLALDDHGKAARQAADLARLAVTRAIVAAAEASAASAVLEHREERLALVAGGALLAIGLGIVLMRRRVLRLRLRVLAVTIPAFFVVYYGLIGTFGQRFSPSLLPANGHLAGSLAKYGLVGMLVQVVASLWSLRDQGTLSERLAAANGIALTGLLVSMVTAGLCWAYFPPPYVTVPGPVWLVLIPAVEVAVACAAVQVALTLGVELIIFAARAWHRERPL